MNTTALTSRHLASVATNVPCQRLARLRALGIPDHDGYRLLTGHELPTGRGERQAALRHGRLFDHNLTDKRASTLIAALQEIAPFEPHSARVLDVEHASRTFTGKPLNHAVLLTEQALNDAVNGQPSQDILLQPALPLTRSEWGDTIVRPDALVLDRERNRYWPLEAKAYPAIDGRIEPAERRSMRLQAAVQVVALHDGLGTERSGSTEAIFVVGSAFGLTPEPAVLETLDAEVSMITRAIDALDVEVDALRAAGALTTPPAALLREARCHLQESCVVGCGLVSYCRSEHQDIRTSVGDRAREVLPASNSGFDYFDELRQRAPETFAVWRDIAALYKLEGEHGTA